MTATETPTKRWLEMLRDESASPQDRGDMLLYAPREDGLDHRETLLQWSPTPTSAGSCRTAWKA